MNQLVGKRLMILGAGPFQAPAIRKAAELGCHVITVDYLPDNVGHKFGHQYVNCSTVDKEGVLRAARNLGIDGICTFSSDVAVPTVAYVCEQLGLPGASPTVAETMATKNRFRAFLRNAHLTCPAFLSGITRLDQLEMQSNKSSIYLEDYCYFRGSAIQHVFKHGAVKV